MDDLGFEELEARSSEIEDPEYTPEELAENMEDIVERAIGEPVNV